MNKSKINCFIQPVGIYKLFESIVVAVLQSQIYFNFNKPLIRGDVISGRQNIGFIGVVLISDSSNEKSWRVSVIKGYVSNDQVKAEDCENCKSTSKVLVTNFNNPNLILLGCKDSKCKHRLLRLNLSEEQL